MSKVSLWYWAAGQQGCLDNRQAQVGVEDVSFYATATGVSGTPAVVWSSSDGSVLAVTAPSSGLGEGQLAGVTGVSQGVADLTATVTDSGGSASGSCKVSVWEAVERVAGVVQAGGEAFNGAFEGAVLRKAAGADVDVEIWGESGAYWWVQFPDGYLDDGSTFRRAFVPKSDVDIPVQSVAVTPGDAALGVGQQVALRAVVLPVLASDRDVVWSSSDTAVATVSSSGVVKPGSKSGSATITAKAGGVKGAATVEVS
ncbi:MAG: Ig-like domain-containing protein, partial [Propionibacteriaceae bacterium]|nr:Ig-like domain-containing protein [Propionibacteriaceae bacterium]